jgi:hypothetical protein
MIKILTFSTEAEKISIVNFGATIKVGISPCRTFRRDPVVESGFDRSEDQAVWISKGWSQETADPGAVLKYRSLLSVTSSNTREV